jgi:YD repeat-containing protein
MKISFLVLIFSLTMCGNAIRTNEEPVTADIPDNVLNIVNVEYPNAVDIQWEKDRKGNFEAEFTSAGKEVELILNSDGVIVRSEVHIEEADLPKIILDSLERKGSMRIARVLEIKEAQTESYYVIALTQTERLKLTYDKSGKLISETKIDRNKKPLVKIPLPATGISSYDRKWELPFILTEISGFTFINTSTIACIQDELGVIYLYDLDKSTIIREIPFGQAGDFEGITMVGNDLWTLRSDGLLYQINNYKDEQPKVKEYPVTLASPQNFEGLCYDKKNNRLLIVPREFDTGNPTIKGVYSFDLNENKFSPKPVFNLDLNHSVFSSLPRKGKTAVLMPSEIAIHPVTSKIYITDARNTQVLILNSKGKIERLIPLNRNIFVKTEGIFFNQKGEVYLSNEGKKQNANLLLLNKGIE